MVLELCLASEESGIVDSTADNNSEQARKSPEDTDLQDGGEVEIENSLMG